MTYRVFYTDLPLPPSQNEPNYSGLIPFVETTEDLAVAKAIALLNHGAFVWRIDGPDEFLMDRGKIQKAYFSKTGKWPKT